MRITAAEAILKMIEKQGVSVVFGYPGATNAPIYDALHKTKLRAVLTRNEQGAAHAASSYFKMTGSIGVCMATSGPGATNLVTGIANAYMDSIPLVAVTGQVACQMVGKDAFQEVDITGVTTPITKHNYLVKNADEIPKIMAEAFYIAGTGRPGPVVVDVPMDVQLQKINFRFPDRPNILGYSPQKPVDPAQVQLLASALKEAKRPLIVAGGGILCAGASCEFLRFLERLALPAVSTLMGISAVPSVHRQFLGMVGLHGTKAANFAFDQADLVVFMGARVSDRSASNPEWLSEHAKIAHVDIDPAEINKNIPCDVSVAGDIKDTLFMLEERTAGVCCPADWLDMCTKAKALDPVPKAGNSAYTNPKYFLKMLSEAVGEDTVISTEVGQNQIWTANHYRFTRPNTFLTSGGFGTMGYGLPAAIGAKIARPEATVIAIEGDGSFQMAMPELAAMKQAGADLKIVLFVNRTLGMVRELQRDHYGANYTSVDLGAYPKYDRIAAAYDIAYGAVRSDSEAENGIMEMLKTDGPFLLEVFVDPEENTL